MGENCRSTEVGHYKTPFKITDAVGREGRVGGCASAVIQRRSWEVMCIAPAALGCIGALSISCRLLLTARLARGRDQHCPLLKCLFSINIIKLERCEYTHTFWQQQQKNSAQKQSYFYILPFSDFVCCIYFGHSFVYFMMSTSWYAICFEYTRSISWAGSLAVQIRSLKGNLKLWTCAIFWAEVFNNALIIWATTFSTRTLTKSSTNNRQVVFFFNVENALIFAELYVPRDSF